MSEIKSISVTQLARRIRNLLEIEIGDVWVEGEISNLRKQSSGHWYFSLKDESSQISCAMFGAKRRAGNEFIEDGAKVQLFGEISFYEARGSTQLIVKKARAVGVGDLQMRFEALKQKLNQEGLFREDRKQKLPSFPQVVGIVTSPTGAALQDMKNVLMRRAPWVTVVLFPTAVQGRGAERGIAREIKRANRASEEGLPQPDVLIVGRGGGSLEDLWNFNEEVVARAIADSQIPIVSAVGHEIDFTISDFASDLRAPTPSAAAELVVPDSVELESWLSQLNDRMKRVVEGRLNRLADRLDFYDRGIFSQSPERILQKPLFRLERVQRDFLSAGEAVIRENEALVNDLENHLAHYHPREVLKRKEERYGSLEKSFLNAAYQALQAREEQLKRLESVLNVLGPNSILERGYSITKNAKGQVVTSIKDVKPGDQLQTKMKDGEVESQVMK